MELTADCQFDDDAPSFANVQSCGREHQECAGSDCCAVSFSQINFLTPTPSVIKCEGVPFNIN